MIEPLPNSRFGVVLLDPPWHFKSYDGKRAVPGRQVVDPYRTMKLPEIKELPVPDVAAKNCAMFMWIVDSHIDQGFDLAKHWGFRFTTRAFTWRKLTKDGQRAAIGMGKWTRKQSELCFLFSKGKPKVLNHDVPEIIDAPRREHSRKPDEAYGRIERLTSGPYLEMFARQSWPGWTSWGNEATKFNEGETL